MAGYIGSKVNVSQIDGYVKSEVDTLLGQELNLSGGSMTGHLNFGDNIKSQYGAGTDLQIYHDASHSYIKDAGTGNLRLSATTIELMKVDTSELMASFSGDGAVTLYYDNAAKLATTATGISVTGTVTATGSIALNDGTDNFNIGVTTNRLTIKSTTSDGSDDTSILIDAGSAGESSSRGGYIEVHGNETSADAGKVIYQMGNVSGSMHDFRKAGGNTAAIIDASGNVGIGVVPEAWYQSYDVLQISSGASLVGSTTNRSRMFLNANTYINTSNVQSYIATDEASQYWQNGGTHIFNVAASGSADSAISWNTAMTINNSGNTAFAGTVAITSNTPFLSFIESDQSNKHYKIGSFGAAFGIYDESASSYRYVLDTNGNHAFNDGNATFAGTIGAAAGTVSLPSLSFAGDPNTGLYRPSSDNLGFAIGGTARAFMSNSQFNVAAKIVATELDINGVADVSSTLTAGALNIPSQGFVFNQGFGTGVPTITMTGTANNGRGGAINFKESDGSGGAIANTAAIYSTDGAGDNATYGGLTIATYQGDMKLSTGGLASPRITILSGGNVGIGSTDPANKLNVQTSSDVRLGVWGGTGYAAIQSTNDANNTLKKLRFDASEYFFVGGNVGIGDTSPDYKLHVNSGATNVAAKFESTDSTAAVMFVDNAGSAEIGCSGNDVVLMPAGAEKLRVDNIGNIKSQYGSGSGYAQTSGSGGLYYRNDDASVGGSVIITNNSNRGWSPMYMNKFDWTSSKDTRFIQFVVNGSGAAGYIRAASASTVTYGTSSDYRLKENVNYEWDATTRLKQLKPARFNFILDGTDTPQDGFMAHEVQDIVPLAISGTKDAMKNEEYEVTPAVLDDDGVETTPAVMGTRSVIDPQGIDHSMLVPLLVKTIQELEARLTAGGL